jgi:NADH dehydrogenase
VAASPLGKILADQSGAEIDRAGRIRVMPDLTIPGYPNVFAVGDMTLIDGVPGQAQGAIQGARYAARLIKAELKGADPATREPFKYFDKGSMATVSRYSAVAKVGPLEFGGFIAWLAWLFLHLIYLVGFKARLVTALSWIGTFLGRHRGQLTITEQQAYARTRIEQLEEIVDNVEDSEKAAS